MGCVTSKRRRLPLLDTRIYWDLKAHAKFTNLTKLNTIGAEPIDFVHKEYVVRMVPQENRFRLKCVIGNTHIESCQGLHTFLDQFQHLYPDIMLLESGLHQYFS